MADTIHLREVLADLDIKVLSNGKPYTFSVGFVIKDGRYVYLKRACSVGLRTSMKENFLKAFQPVDQDGKNVGHRYPVSIWSIMNYNDKQVVL